MQPQKKETTLKSTDSALQSVPGWIPVAALTIILSLSTAVAFAQAAPANPVQPKPAAAPLRSRRAGAVPCPAHSANCECRAGRSAASGRPEELYRRIAYQGDG